MDHYQVLGVSRNASAFEIEAAFERLKQEHDGKAVREVHKAYFWLHDPDRRKEYDQLLESQLSAARQVSEPTGLISDEEFRSWLEPGKTIMRGIAAKRESERVLREKKQKDEMHAKAQNQQGRYGRFVAPLLGLGIVLVLLNGPHIWDYLDELGYIHHDWTITVYSPDWQNGEYKTCTTINSASRQVGNILCDGGVPSGRVEDGKVFKVRFYGRVYDAGKPAFDRNVPNVAGAVLYWNCRKMEGGDPSVTCEQAPEKEPK